MKMGDKLIKRYFLCNSLSFLFVYQEVKNYLYVKSTIRRHQLLFPRFLQAPLTNS